MSRKVFSSEELLAIGLRIKQARGLMTQAEFAKRIYVGRSGLSNYEAGRRLPNNEILERIAEYSDLSSKYILYGGEGSLTRYPTAKVQADNAFAYSLMFAFYERLQGKIPFRTEHKKMLWWGDVSSSLIDYSENLLFSIASKNDEDMEVALKIALDGMSKMNDGELLDIITGTTLP